MEDPVGIKFYNYGVIPDDIRSIEEDNKNEDEFMKAVIRKYKPSLLRQHYLFYSTTPKGNYIKVYYLDKNKNQILPPVRLVLYLYGGLDLTPYRDRLVFIFSSKPKKNTLFCDKQLESSASVNPPMLNFTKITQSSELEKLGEKFENKQIETQSSSEDTVSNNNNNNKINEKVLEMPIVHPSDLNRIKVQNKNTEDITIKNIPSLDFFIEIFSKNFNIATPEFIVEPISRQQSTKQNTMEQKKKTENTQQNTVPTVKNTVHSEKKTVIVDTKATPSEKKIANTDKKTATVEKKEKRKKEDTPKEKPDPVEKKQKTETNNEQFDYTVNPYSILLQHMFDTLFAQNKLGLPSSIDKDLLSKYFSLSEAKGLSELEKNIMCNFFDLVFLKLPPNSNDNNLDNTQVSSIYSYNKTSYTSICKYKVVSDNLHVTKTYFKLGNTYMEKVIDCEFSITKEKGKKIWEKFGSIVKVIEKKGKKNISADEMILNDTYFKIAFHIFITMFAMG